MSYILTSDTLIGSARILAEGLGMGTRYTTTNEPPTIRWGSSAGSERFAGRDTVFNSPAVISLCGSKTRLATKLVDRDFPVVEFRRGTPTQYPVCIRTVLNGHGGAGIIIARTPEEFSAHRESYWSPWYTFRYEYGVHILGGEVAKIFKKVWDNDANNEPEFPIRNQDMGYSFKRISNEGFGRIAELRDFVHRLYAIVPVKMARIDVAFEEAIGGFRLIEINTAPALTNNADTARTYVDYLRTALEL
jgi:hypothetical protein